MRLPQLASACGLRAALQRHRMSLKPQARCRCCCAPSSSPMTRRAPLPRAAPPGTRAGGSALPDEFSGAVRKMRENPCCFAHLQRRSASPPPPLTTRCRQAKGSPHRAQLTPLV
jgi:hypothetical protein